METGLKPLTGMGHDGSPIVDVHGEPLFEGSIVRVITDDHNWTKKGDLLILNKYAQKTMREGIYTIPYADVKGSSSSIHSSQVELVEDGWDIFYKQQLRWRKAHLLKAQAKNQVELEKVEYELRQLHNIEAEKMICENCGHSIGE